MWLIIYREDVGWGELAQRVFAIETVEPPEGAYKEEKFEVKEWDGPMPSLGDPLEDILPDLDPTLDDPDYEDFQQAASDFRALRDAVADELEYLADVIPTIDTMTVEELRAAFKRSEQRDRQLLRALRYVFRRLL